MLTRAQLMERHNYYSDSRVISSMAGNTTEVIINGSFNWGFLTDEYLGEGIQENIHQCFNWNKTAKFIAEYLGLDPEDTSDEASKKTSDFIYEDMKRTLLIWLACEWPEFEIDAKEVATCDVEDLSFPEYTLSSKWAICGQCDGEGKHVNPSIDCGGITQSEWENEWDYEEREAYMSGRYDVQCQACGGSGKVRVYADAKSGSFLEWCYNEHDELCNSRYADALERAAELRMGC